MLCPTRRGSVSAPAVASTTSISFLLRPCLPAVGSLPVAVAVPGQVEVEAVVGVREEGSYEAPPLGMSREAVEEHHDRTAAPAASGAPRAAVSLGAIECRTLTGSLPRAHDGVVADIPSARVESWADAGPDHDR